MAVAVAQRTKTCRCSGCEAGLEPFTTEHFRDWAAGLILDTDQPWEIEPFQEAFVDDVFSGVPECWLVVPEENAKSTLVSGLGLYHIEHKQTARVSVAASSRDQAGIIFERCDGFVLRSDLEEVFRCQEGHRRVLCDRTHSRLQIFAADERTGDGIIPTLCILEELHRHRNLSLYRTWRGKLGKRGAQMVAISTAGEPGSEFEEAREAMRQSADEIERAETYVRAVSKRFALHDWAVPEDGNEEDLELVARANPLRAVTVDRLREKRESPTWQREHWRRFVCNLPTRGPSAAIQEAEWYAAESKERIPEGESVWLGLDVGWKWDTTALVPLWVKSPEFRLFGESKILEPPRDGTTLDPDKVKQALIETNQRNPIHTVVMDMSRAEDLANWIDDELEARVIERGQSNTMAVLDYERFLEGLRAGWLKHCGDKELTRHVLNAVARILPGGDARFDRPKSTRQGGDQSVRVIDGLQAAGMVNTVVAAELAGETTSSWKAF